LFTERGDGMSVKKYVVELTLMQLNHALTVIAQDAKALDAQIEADEDGGVYEDYLIAKSILDQLEQAKHGQEKS
jgi:hypothetical protein